MKTAKVVSEFQQLVPEHVVILSRGLCNVFRLENYKIVDDNYPPLSRITQKNNEGK